MKHGFHLTFVLAHWGRVTHICVGNLTIIGSDNGLSPTSQAIIWTNAGILSTEQFGTNFSKILYILLKICVWKCRLQNGGHLPRPQFVNYFGSQRCEQVETLKYRQVSNIRRTFVGNLIVNHSDVVGASPVGAAPTTSSFSALHSASIDWAKTNARRYENYLIFGIWCVSY